MAVHKNKYSNKIYIIIIVVIFIFIIYLIYNRRIYERFKDPVPKSVPRSTTQSVTLWMQNYITPIATLIDSSKFTLPKTPSKNDRITCADNDIVCYMGPLTITSTLPVISEDKFLSFQYDFLNSFKNSQYTQASNNKGLIYRIIQYLKDQITYSNHEIIYCYNENGIYIDFCKFAPDNSFDQKSVKTIIMQYIKTPDHPKPSKYICNPSSTGSLF